MDLFDAIKRRHSYRGKFLKDRIPSSDLEQIVQDDLIARMEHIL